MNELDELIEEFKWRASLADELAKSAFVMDSFDEAEKHERNKTKWNKVAELLEELKEHKSKDEKTSDDCIRREEAIRIAEQGQIQGYEWQFKKLCDLPPVTPKGVTVTDFADRCRECGAEYGKMLESMKPKPGRWKPFGILHKCSKCGMCFGTKTNFCPNCGADMRETRESKKNYISEEDNKNGK